MCILSWGKVNVAFTIWNIKILWQVHSDTGHSQANMKVIVLEKAKKEDKNYREVRESYLINKLNTFYMGMNRKKWGRRGEAILYLSFYDSNIYIQKCSSSQSRVSIGSLSSYSSNDNSAPRRATKEILNTKSIRILFPTGQAGLKYGRNLHKPETLWYASSWY